MAGTFDLQNYGDLLFPLIAEAELSRRIGPIELSRFSYHRKAPPAWPYEVRAVSDLPELAGSLDAMLIGGGDLIRFDKNVAPGYGPPSSDIHHPCGYWLSPALIAAQHGCPVVWNAPGVFGEIPDWAEPLMGLALEVSKYVAVRDEPSRQALLRFAGDTEIAVTPDTCFGIAGLLNAGGRADEFRRLRQSLGLTQPFIAVQATSGLEGFCRMVGTNPRKFAEYRMVALEVGPALGDDGKTLAAALPDIVQLPGDVHPLVLAELITEAAGVVGPSLHLAITALASGLPVFRPADLVEGKYAVLSGFDSVHVFDSETTPEPEWFLEKLGAAGPGPQARASLAKLADHWDKVASVVTNSDRRATRDGVGRFWPSHPVWLEARSAEVEQREARIDERDRQNAALNDRIAVDLEAARQEMARVSSALSERDQQIQTLHAVVAERDRQVREGAAALEVQLKEFHSSTSWKVSAPLRWIGRRIRRRENGRVA